MIRVKICGLTSVDQALACVDAGADAIGINFVPSSPRRVETTTGRAIADAVGDRALVVAVVAGLSVAEMRDLSVQSGAGCLQLHGEESPAELEALLPHAYKAVRVASSEDVRSVDSWPGEYLMVDAKVPGMLGGTGHQVDRTLVVELARKRKLVLAGGLTPDNVREAILQVRPWCVDVASGVESAPGVKDLSKVRAFVEAARGA